MAQLIQNDASGQVSGTTATQAVGGNTGGVSGNFIDVWSKGTSATVTFDNTFVGDSINMYKIAVAGTSTTCIGKWVSTTLTSTATTKFWRFYWAIQALPPVATMLIGQFLDSAAASVGGMTLSSAGALKLTNAALTPEVTSGVNFSTNTLYRSDVKMTSHVSAGVLEMRTYDHRKNPLVWLDRQTIGSQVMNGNAVQQLNFGVGTAATSWAIWMLPAVSDVDFIGPRSVAAAAVGSF